MARNGKDDAVADKDFVMDFHTGADETMALHLDPLTDPNIALNFDKGADGGVVANFASVNVGETEKADVLPQFYVIGNNQVRVLH